MRRRHVQPCGEARKSRPIGLHLGDGLGGHELGALTADARKKFGIKDGAEGVLVVAVDPSSQAAEKRVNAGDRILEINQETMAKPEDVTKKLKALKDQGRKSALVFVASPNDDKRFVPLPLE